MKNFTGTKQEINQFLFNLDNETIYDIKLEKHHNKRGPQANKYAWELMTQISRAVIKSKEEIYQRMLSDYGVLKTDEDDNYIIGFFDKNANLNRIGSYWKFIEYVTVNNEVKKKCMLLKGSSEYNTKEMSDFIKGIEQEARALDIETLSDIEFRQMMEAYEGEHLC